MITEAQAAGLTTEKACAVIGLSPRTLQRWQASAPEVAAVPEAAGPATPRPRPHNALTESIYYGDVVFRTDYKPSSQCDGQRVV